MQIIQPNGLIVVPEAISQEEQASLIKDIVQKGKWNNALKRRTQHYGYRYDYRAKNISKSDFLGPFPEWLQNLSNKLQLQLSFIPEQAIINEYSVGQEITPHIDAPHLFGPIVASLSLCSNSKMIFEKRGSPVSVVELPARSLVILTGESRSNWFHSIPPVKEYRLSVTFRTVIVKF
jgi:alkylated DNA repair dioxygenase AlkB